jgi:SNF2 family DNA or RNA helicase
MTESQSPRFRIGDQVRLRSRRDRAGVITVPEPRFTYGEWWYTVFFGPGRSGRHPENDLELFSGSLDDVAGLVTGGLFGGREALTKLLCHLRLSTALRSQIYSLRSSRTRFYAYQFKPVLKFLESRRGRLLIADEVGLGKTIETGLILTELRQRRPLRRVLIVPPHHLVIKWRDEMRNRFGFQFDILDSRRALDFLREYDREQDETLVQGILSLQSLRGSRLLERWREVEPHLDLVVFDEAGRLRNAETKSHEAAELLGGNADAMLLLTATPVQTHDQDLFNLLYLLEPEEFSSYAVFVQRLEINRHVLETLQSLGRQAPLRDCTGILRQVEQTAHVPYFRDNPLYQDVLARLGQPEPISRRVRIELQRDLNALNMLGHVLSRTRKREVQEFQPARRARVIRGEATPEEQGFYELVTRMCRQAYRRLGGTSFAAFATMMPQRQVASCMVAMVDTLLERGGRVSAAPGAIVEESDLTGEDFEFEPEDESVQTLTLSPSELQSWRVRLAERDSKWASLRTALAELEHADPGAKVIVYSYFKRTLGYLGERMRQEGIETVTITGDVLSVPDDPERDERGRRLLAFRTDPRVRVLLATEVGDEGLDLQFCHTIVNYDLPWNPMRVEQRIGRVDRLGQRSQHVTIISLSMPGTIEDRILERLYHRIGIFERSIGDLEPILGEEVKRLTAELFSGDLSPEEQERLIEQAADVVERRRQEQERWEAETSALIGHDEFFLDEITRARDRHRYVGGEELLIYLRDYLAANHRGCTIEGGDLGGVYRLRVDDGLREFVREAVPGADPGLRTFLAGSARGEVVFTVDQDLAEEHRDLEFLTFYHPLIRAINRYYEMHPAELHPVSYVRLRSTAVTAGTYAWFLYLVEITGARPLRDLELVGIGVEDGEALSADDSELLLADMVVAAEWVPPSHRTARVDATFAHLAEEVVAARLAVWFAERERLNDALVGHRLASVEQSFKRTERMREEAIAQARARSRQERYIRGLETALRNLRAAHAVKVREIEAGRQLGRRFELRGAGIVEVRHHAGLARGAQGNQAATARAGGGPKTAGKRGPSPGVAA